MDGAGSVRATNYVYSVAPKDGTVLGATNQNMPMYQLLGGKEARFDAAKFNWLGTQAWSNGMVYTWHATGIKTLDEARKRDVSVGGAGTSSDSFIYPTIINYLTGTKFKVINGYKGSSEIHLALERGEVEARGGNSWASLTSSNPEWLKDRKINLLIQVGVEKEADIPEVPLLVDEVKGEEAKQIATLVSIPTAIGYTVFAAPDVPAARIAALRAAFDATMKDPEFLADADKHKMLIKPRTGAEVAKLVASVKDTPPAVLKKTAEILNWND
jgi:tripartite-type tricarboxylate transporter receptor subunit TctC